MPVVRMILREDRKSCTTRPMRLFIPRIARYGITRNQDSIAEFQSEYSQYWEYVADTSAARPRTPKPIRR